MKIADLRALLANASTDDLLKILSELYKRIPKSLKEAPVDGVDIAIKAILSHQDIGKKAQKTKTIDFDSLHDQITTFLDYADEGYYISPNRVVPKAQRSKWRFLVMGFIKDIQKIGLNDENYDNSNSDLLSLYTTLCKGCGFYIFRTEDPFASINLPQTDFYQMLCSRFFAKGFDDENIGALIECCTVVNIDRVSLYSELLSILIDHIVDKDDIIYTINFIKDNEENIARGSVAYSQQSSVFSDYSERENHDHLAALAMGLYFKIGEYDKGCEYYWDTCEKYNVNVYPNRKPGQIKEVLFYCLLKFVSYFSDDKNLWIKYYEKYSKEYAHDVEPRESLVQEYQELKQELS